MLAVVVLSLLSTITYGQFSIKEIISLSEGDTEKFEINTMSAGYIFYELLDEDCCEGIRMTKGNGAQTRYITYYSKFFDDLSHINYQTGVVSEMSKIYKELGDLGFELTNREESEGNYVKDYSRDKEYVSIYIKNDWIVLGYYKSN